MKIIEWHVVVAEKHCAPVSVAVCASKEEAQEMADRRIIRGERAHVSTRIVDEKRNIHRD